MGSNILITILNILLADYLFGQWCNDPAINLTIALWDETPYVVEDGSEGFLVAFNHRYYIAVMRYNADGEFTWPDTTFIPCPSGWGDFINLKNITKDGSGGVILLYDAENPSWEILLLIARVNASGAIVYGGLTPKIVDDTQESYYSQLVGDGAGGAYVMWERDDDYQIWAGYANASGNMIYSNNLTIRSDTYYFGFWEPGNSNGKNICEDGLGNAICGWGEFDFYMYSYSYAQKLTPSSASWGSGGKLVLTDHNRYDTYPIGIDGDSYFIVNTPEAYGRVVCQKLNPSGNRQWSDSGKDIVVDPAEDNCGLTCYSDGLIIAWEDDRVPGDDIYVMKMNSSGNRTWSPSSGVPVITGTPGYDLMGLVNDDSGGCAILYRDPSNRYLYLSHINSSGAIAWTTTVTTSRYATDRGMLIKSVSDYIIVWEDDRIGTHGIYAQKVSSGGTLVGEPPSISSKYVATSGSDETGDGSEENPFATIQHAIDFSNDGDSVFVKPGTYTGGGNHNINFNGKELYVSSCSGPDSTIIDCSGTRERGFVFTTGEDSFSVLKGFKIKKGSRSIGSGIYFEDCSPKIYDCIICSCSAEYGAGVYCDFGASPILKNCRISKNNATAFGGGIFCYESPIKLTSVIIDSNSSYKGAGIYLYLSDSASLDSVIITGNICDSPYSIGGGACVSYSDIFISNSEIKANQANEGGGIRFAECNPILTNVVISENKANNGSGIFFYNYCEAILDSVTIERNQKNLESDFGGGIFCYHNCNPILRHVSIINNEGSGLFCRSNSNPILENSIIKGNTAVKGAGIYCDSNSKPRLINVVVDSNNAYINGGGIYSIDSDFYCENVLLIRNTANSIGGGVYCLFSSPILVNSTINKNIADSVGGGVFCDTSSVPILFNTILWDNYPQEIFPESSLIKVYYSDIKGGWEGDGNIDSNPIFADSIGGDYHLQSTSPCIEAGAGSIYIEILDTVIYAPTEDIEGTGRPLPAGARWDIGAYEYDPVYVEELNSLPKKCNLLAYPNPFNSSCRIAPPLEQRSRYLIS